MTQLNECQVAHITIFCPKPDENVYLQWFKDDPSDGAVGPVFQFFTVSVLDEDVYTQVDKQVSHFSVEDSDIPGLDAFLALAESVSQRLGISEQLAIETMRFLDALLCDEADDLDNSRFDYRWVDYPNAFLVFSSELGKPANRVHIKVKSSQFLGEVTANIDESNLNFDTDGLGLALAISQFEQTE